MRSGEPLGAAVSAGLAGDGRRRHGFNTPESTDESAIPRFRKAPVFLPVIQIGVWPGVGGWNAFVICDRILAWLKTGYS